MEERFIGNFDDIDGLELECDAYKMFFKLNNINVAAVDWDRVFDLLGEIDQLITPYDGNMDWKKCG
ncbi:MAG: hypothetical protein IKE53_09775 [Clostridiales bacterium]|nr:hypothetical protein [Clostridiales bacterium]